MNILLIGQGEIGHALALSLVAQNQYKITALARTPKSYPKDSRIVFWQKSAQTLTKQELAPFSHIVVIVAPSHQVVMQDKTQAYRECYFDIAHHLASMAKALPALQRLIFVSSTSVYGENEGQTIDIHSPVVPSSEASKLLHQAEVALQTAFGGRCVIVRPSGIYGASRLRLLTLAKTAPEVKTKAWTNRIMDTDLVRVLHHIIDLPDCQKVYLATDFCPVPYDEVLRFIAHTLGYPLPVCQKSTPAGKKIISNLPKQWLTFADYRQGYRHIISKQSPQANEMPIKKTSP